MEADGDVTRLSLVYADCDVVDRVWLQRNAKFGLKEQTPLISFDWHTRRRNCNAVFLSDKLGDRFRCQGGMLI